MSNQNNNDSRLELATILDIPVNQGGRVTLRQAIDRVAEMHRKPIRVMVTELPADVETFTNFDSSVKSVVIRCNDSLAPAYAVSVIMRDLTNIAQLIGY